MYIGPTEVMKIQNLMSRFIKRGSTASFIFKFSSYTLVVYFINYSAFGFNVFIFTKMSPVY